MKKTSTFMIIAIMMALHCFLALIYCNNQIPNLEGLEILTQTYNIHYTEGMFDYSNDTITTLVTTIPMRIYENLFAPIASIILIRLTAFLILFVALKNLLHRNTMLWFSTVYLLSPWILFNSNFEYIAFLELGTACYVLSVVKINYYKQIDNNTTGQRFWFFLHLISILWCAHFHCSWVILALTTIFLIARDVIRFSLRGFISALIVCVITTLPIILDPNKLPSTYDSIKNVDNLGYGLIHLYPMAKSLLYWLRFSSTLGTNDMLLTTSFSWMSNNADINQIIRYIWLGAVYLAGTATMLVSICSNYLFLKNSKGTIFKRTVSVASTELLSILAIGIIGGAIVFSAAMPHLINSNDLLICFDFSLIPFLLFIEKFHKTPDSYHFSMICITVVFLLFLNLFPAINSVSYSPDGILLEQATEINNEQFN